jgi:tyrosyl-tRNA synthetase
MNFIDIIKERGFVHQMTDEAGLRELLKTPGQTAYIGFDCTAKSLHVGSLLQIMLLRWWQKCGHRPIVLLGGGTTKIGDPSGKDESRPPLTDAQIQENMDSLKTVFSQFLLFSNNESPTPENAALMVNNDEWLSGLNYAQFLREYGRHFSINRMLTMDSVKLRLEREQTLSFLEFNYMILQAYDFVELNRRHNCRIQMGGSDQWGNIINGVELHRRVTPYDLIQRTANDFAVTGSQIEGDRIFIVVTKAGEILHKELCQDWADFELKRNQLSTKFATVIGEPDYKASGKALFGITSPLLTTSSGAKMGKTAVGAVWLNADLLSPYDYWQFWRNTEDADVAKFLKLFTELSLDEIAALTAPSANINDAKARLATEATALLHGREEAEKAAQTARDIFSGSGVSANLPEYITPFNDMPVYELLVKTGFAASNSEAKRDIKGQGISVNDIKVTNENHRLSEADFAQGFAKLSKGKKKHVLVKIS